MKNCKYCNVIAFSFLFILSSCNKDKLGIDPVDNTQLNDPIHNFVWNGMNEWYNWNTEVPNLDDTKNDDRNEYYAYLNSFTSPKKLFKSVLTDTINKDRFSWFIEDYDIQNQQFQGISRSFGFRLQAVQINTEGDIIFYVRYVASNSPADAAGIKRGDIINAINGVQVTQSNYSAAVGGFSNESIALTFVSENNGIFEIIGDKEITADVISENPVHYQDVFSGIDGKKVGYLVYNGFRTSYNDELNTAFELFKSEGIEELVLDLRLNGGGSVLTSAYLASMITQNAGSEVFAELKFNSKHSNENGAYYFQNSMSIYNSIGDKIGEESINRLNTLSRIYVLTSGSTASASEMIINGLRPFMEVITIGTTTYGKNLGSITLYDSPSTLYTSEDGANANHKNAMQPIVFQIYNKAGESDYYLGFEPNIEVKEWSTWNAIYAFGDENETLLKAALDNIKGIATKPAGYARYPNIKPMEIPQLRKQFDREMYIGSDFFEK